METVKPIDSPRSSKSIERNNDSDNLLLGRPTSEDLIQFNDRTGHHRLIPQSARNFFHRDQKRRSSTRDAPSTSTNSDEHTRIIPTRRPDDKPAGQPAGEPAGEPTSQPITAQPHRTVLCIRNNGGIGFHAVAMGKRLTAKSLIRECDRCVEPYTIKQILYWNPFFKCWTGAIASGTLDLMKADAENFKIDILHVFVLRTDLELGGTETAADLPFMKEDGDSRWRVAPMIWLRIEMEEPTMGNEALEDIGLFY
ncbi:hypothetical protein VTL71DRAFT_4558 [Oculimacula yallundae]|uniref:Uncharacterized protein n=1 Tax=Oculimacula yallundae TaxID=86028 RepID=A0ABR4C2D6_9HELO